MDLDVEIHFMEMDAEKLRCSNEEIESLSRFILNYHAHKYQMQSTVSHGNKFEINSEVILDNLASLLGFEVDYVKEKRPGHHGLTNFTDKKIVIYNNDNHETIRFSCAHELFHLLMHRKFYGEYGYVLKHCSPPSFFESNANVFARTLLTPKNISYLRQFHS